MEEEREPDDETLLVAVEAASEVVANLVAMARKVALVGSETKSRDA